MEKIFQSNRFQLNSCVCAIILLYVYQWQVYTNMSIQQHACLDSKSYRGVSSSSNNSSNGNDDDDVDNGSGGDDSIGYNFFWCSMYPVSQYTDLHVFKLMHAHSTRISNTKQSRQNSIFFSFFFHVHIACINAVNIYFNVSLVILHSGKIFTLFLFFGFGFASL